MARRALGANERSPAGLSKRHPVLPASFQSRCTKNASDSRLRHHLQKRRKMDIPYDAGASYRIMVIVCQCRESYLCHPIWAAYSEATLLMAASQYACGSESPYLRRFMASNVLGYGRLAKAFLCPSFISIAWSHRNPVQQSYAIEMLKLMVLLTFWEVAHRIKLYDQAL